MIKEICSLCVILTWSWKGYMSRARPHHQLRAASTWAGSAAWRWHTWAAPVCSQSRSEGTGCLRSAPRFLQIALARSQRHAFGSGRSLPDLAHTSPCHPYLHAGGIRKLLSLPFPQNISHEHHDTEMPISSLAVLSNTSFSIRRNHLFNKFTNSNFCFVPLRALSKFINIPADQTGYQD